MPVITANDCEGAGETFNVQVTILMFSFNICCVSANLSLSFIPFPFSPPQPSKDISLESDSDDETRNPHFFRVPAFLTVSGQLHLEVATG